MAENFQISIPIKINLHIRQCCVVPYISVVKMSKDTSRSTAACAVKKWAKTYAKKHNLCKETYKITFPGERWGDLHQGLSNPSNSIAIFFTGGRHFLKIIGFPSGTEIFVINDVFYKRMTWREVGVNHRRQGMVAKTSISNKKTFSYFLLKCGEINKNPMRSVILSGLEERMLSDF